MTSVSLLYNIYDCERSGRVAQGGHAKVPVRQRQRESGELLLPNTRTRERKDIPSLGLL